MRIVAWHAALTMNVHIAKKSQKVTVKKLLGEKDETIRFERGGEGREKFLKKMREIKRRELKKEALRDGD